MISALLGYYIQSNNSALYLPRGKYDLKKMLNKVNQSNCWLNKAHFSVIPCNLKQAIPSSHNIKILKMFFLVQFWFCFMLHLLFPFAPVPSPLELPWEFSPATQKSLLLAASREISCLNYIWLYDCEFFSSPFSFAFFILNLKRKWSSPDLT